MKYIAAFLSLALVAFSFPVYAADSGAQTTAIEQMTSNSSSPAAEPAPAPQDPATLEKRLELAKKMHELRPTKEQVYGAIDQVAVTQPESEREGFKQAMRTVLNYKAIEKISIDSMAETYTVPELEAMVEYFSKPEAISASKKEIQYSSKVYPEIIRMLDQAMMKVRTGGDTATPPGPATNPSTAIPKN